MTNAEVKRDEELFTLQLEQMGDYLDNCLYSVHVDKEDESDPAELTGQLEFTADDFISEDWETDYDY